MADSGLSLLLPVSLVHPEDTLAESAQLYINHLPYLNIPWVAMLMMLLMNFLFEYSMSRLLYIVNVVISIQYIYHIYTYVCGCRN